MDGGALRPAGAPIRLAIVLFLPLLAACASANPSNRPVATAEAEVAAPAGQDAWPLASSASAEPPPVVAPTGTTGRTTDPGTRYLSVGSVGAITVETPPAPPSPEP